MDVSKVDVKSNKKANYQMNWIYSLDKLSFQRSFYAGKLSLDI